MKLVIAFVLLNSHVEGDVLTVTSNSAGLCRSMANTIKTFILEKILPNVQSMKHNIMNVERVESRSEGTTYVVELKKKIGGVNEKASFEARFTLNLRGLTS